MIRVPELELRSLEAAEHAFATSFLLPKELLISQAVRHHWIRRTLPPAYLVPNHLHETHTSRQEPALRLRCVKQRNHSVSYRLPTDCKMNTHKHIGGRLWFRSPAQLCRGPSSPW